MNPIVPPHSIEAEQSALGSMMIEQEALFTGLELLTAADFYRPVHAEIFEVLKALGLRKEPVDLITTQEELRKRGSLQEIGGTEYLIACTDRVPTARNIRHYAEIVAQKSLLRRVIAAATELQAAAMGEEPDIAERFIEKAISLGHASGVAFRPIREVADTVWKRLESYQHGKPKRGIGFGLGRLDRLTHGACPADLILIGGRPSDGKTCLLTQLAINAALGSVPTLFFSQEMTMEDIVERAVLMKARIDGARARNGKIEDEEWDRLAEITGRLWETAFWISDLPASTMQIVAATKRAILQHKIGLVVVDYLQIVRCPGRFGNRNEQVQKITEDLKGLAQEARVPVVVATQLSRASQKREDKHPRLDDLREGGNQEAAADKVILIYNPHREEIEADEDHDPTRKALLIVAKHRGGRTGEIVTWFHPQWTRFDECEEKWEEPKKSGNWREDWKGDSV